MPQNMIVSVLYIEAFMCHDHGEGEGEGEGYSHVATRPEVNTFLRNFISMCSSDGSSLCLTPDFNTFL